MVPQEQRRNCRVQLGGEGTAVWSAKRRLGIEDRIGRIEIVQSAGIAVGIVFFFNRWLHRISRILAVLDYEGVKQATPEVLRPKGKSSAHSL